MTLERVRRVLTERLDPARTADYLTVVRAITAQTGGAVGHGVIPCPICGTGALAYQVTATASPRRHRVRAVCPQAGCVRFSTEHREE